MIDILSIIEKDTVQFNSLIRHDGVTPEIISCFRELIWQYYQNHGRIFPWRQTSNPYHILVSEVMLQQTQTSRVMKKYSEFVDTFPDFSRLARAPFSEVLKAWQGLGYNRRALALQKTAREVVECFNGNLPSTTETLQRLPGIGHYTAAAIATMAFNKPTVLIETNIRTVFLHFFFEDTVNVADHDILPLVKLTLDTDNPKEWYYALFDHGALLKRSGKKDTQSIHYRKQSTFKGSNREIRGRILQILLTRTAISEREIIPILNIDSVRVKHSLEQLDKEGFIDVCKGTIRIK